MRKLRYTYPATDNGALGIAGVGMQNRWLVELIVSWLPFIVLIGVWVWLSRRWSPGNSAKLIQLYEQQVAETGRMNAFLERIAVSLEKRTTE